MTESRPVSPEGPAPLDCPFCGEVARLHAAAISLGFYRVGCNNPNCIQPEAFADEKVDAIARWNRRPSRSAGSPETQRRIAGIPFRVNRRVPPNEVQVWQNGLCVYRLTNMAGSELVAGSASPAASPADGASGTRQCRCGEWVRDRRTPPIDEEWSVGASFVVDANTGALHSCKALLATSGDREDSERLNFLENSRRGMEYLTCDDQDGEPTRHFWMVDDVLPDKYRVTLREAIDAARCTPAVQET